MNNQDAHNEVTAEFTRYKNEKTTREHRMSFADDLYERFFAENGDFRIATTVLDRLTTLILKDELSDTHPDKMSREDYPIMSARQEDTRRRKERSMSAAQDIAISGIDYREQTRDSRRKYRESFGI